jgi:hypothetical protein
LKYSGSSYAAMGKAMYQFFFLKSDRHYSY